MIGGTSMVIICRDATLEDKGHVARVFAYENGFHVDLQPEVFNRLDESTILADDWYEKAMDDDAARIVLAEENGTVLGLVYYSIVRTDNPILRSDRLVYVDELVVMPEHQGRGIGRTLMEHVEDHARKEGVHTVKLQVWDNNEGALGFYRSMGYDPRERVLWKTL
jgi:ribosomal protein S18 acetylase RimI-like enzyme